MQKAIVTGGLGFIGSNLIDLLIKKNFHVINFDKVSYASNFYNTKNYKLNKKYKFIKIDLNEKQKIERLMLISLNMIKLMIEQLPLEMLK